MKAAQGDFGNNTGRGWTQLGPRAISALAAGSLMLAAAAAWAGVGLGVTPVFPNAVKVGDKGLPAFLVISNANTAPNDVHGNVVTGISITPSCGVTPLGSAVCPGPSQEPGNPISLSTQGMGSDDCRDPGAPNVIPNPHRVFTIAQLGAPGTAYTITPDFYLPPGGTCIITFTIDINAMPTKDSSNRSGTQTAALAGASAVDAVNNFDTGGGIGAAQVSFPVLTTTPSAGGNLGAAPLSLSDSATIVGLVPGLGPSNPTGSVTFRLFAPNDAACTGVPFGTETVQLTDASRCTITPGTFLTQCTMGTPIVVNAAGTWHWTATYTPDANNIQVDSACISEPVNVGPAQPTLATVPNPAPGRVGSALNDTAQLSNGQQPYAGTITFNLYDPTQLNCTGAPRFTQTVPVSGTGAAATAPGFIADMSGTWQWTANYTSSNANNANATSTCGAEPVVVPRPVLTIQKTPDNQTYAAGQTISFTINVTNQGPGSAINVRFQPADKLPDPNASLQWSISTQPAGNPCAISGAAGAQLLNCAFGTLAEGASVSVTVQTATQAADPGDCGNPLTLNNSATVIADNADPKSDPGSLVCQPGQTTLTTIPTPPAGKVGGPALNDSAQLTGTAPFTGAITFNLYDPTQINCTGVPRFTQQVNVTAAGAAVTTGGFVADKSGTWQWTANYAGDANHNPATSGCGAEPVNIARPVLTIAKTPDNGTYTPGQTISWTIVVSNQGPGTAQGVMFAPADILPDPNKSLNWAVATQPVGGNCTVAGAAGSQALNCTFGDLAEGAAATVVVSTATQANDPGDCPTAGPLTNSATVTATNADPKTDNGSQACLGRPVLRVVKTPDGGLYNGGDTITFSIAVTNDGPGIANNVRLEPADLLPDPAASLNWSISVQPAQGTCTISGAIGSQVLNCNFGNMAQGQTLIVTVKTDTQAGDPGDCSPNGTVLTNVAAVVGDNTNPATDSGSQSCKASRPIPTLTPLGMGLLLMLLGGAGFIALRRRQS